MVDRQQIFPKSKLRLSSVLLAASICVSNGWTAAEDQKEARSFMRVFEDGNASINVRDVSLASVLDQLLESHGINVVIPDFKDRPVTINANRVPVTTLIEKMIHPNERFWIVSERDLVIPNRELSRTGLKPDGSLGKPRKGEPEDIQDSGERMSPPREIEHVVTRGDAGTMKSPVQIIATTSELQPRDEILPSTPEQNYGRIRFLWEGDTITPISMTILPGNYVYQSGIKGEYVYVVRLEDEVVAVESFQDPRRLHSHYPKPNRPHVIIESKTGEFDASIPDLVLTTEAISRITVSVYKFVDQPPTRELSPETFSEFEKVLEKAYSISESQIRAMPIEDRSE